jgi:hypothetical protein
VRIFTIDDILFTSAMFYDHIKKSKKGKRQMPQPLKFASVSPQPMITQLDFHRLTQYYDNY